MFDDDDVVVGGVLIKICVCVFLKVVFGDCDDGFVVSDVCVDCVVGFGVWNYGGCVVMDGVY